MKFEKVDNSWLQEKHGFIIEDAEFKKNYLHLLTKDFFEEWMMVFGKPSDYEDYPEYYLRLAFGLVGMQIYQRISDKQENERSKE